MACGRWCSVVFVLVAALFVARSHCKIYFLETFSDSSWKSRWIPASPSTQEDQSPRGEFKRAHGKWYASKEEASGLKTTENSRFYLISAALSEPFRNQDKPLIIQYEVKHEQELTCGGGYIKLLPHSSMKDQTLLSPSTEYSIMFGPDSCGEDKHKTHVILTRNSTHYNNKRDIVCAQLDHLSHLYTLVLRPGNTWELRIDNKENETGSLIDDYDMSAPRTILDLSVRRPIDWVTEPLIVDVNDKKPDDWESPEFIPDPMVVKPEEWEDEIHGAWVQPMIPNGNYQPEWTPRLIMNPEYKGPWIRPTIPNPAFWEDPNLYVYDIGYVAVDIWQDEAGSIFDNILITDDISEAEEWGKKWESNAALEKAMYEKHLKKVEKKAERQRMKEAKERGGWFDPEDYPDPYAAYEKMTKEEQEKMRKFLEAPPGSDVGNLMLHNDG
ncbi:calreticulin precursor [Pelomyxa schiedti]|nr:calreticulin precursor [Pelomyxa schiedti]